MLFRQLFDLVELALHYLDSPMKRYHDRTFHFLSIQSPENRQLCFKHYFLLLPIFRYNFSLARYQCIQGSTGDPIDRDPACGRFVNEVEFAGTKIMPRKIRSIISIRIWTSYTYHRPSLVTRVLSKTQAG